MGFIVIYTDILWKFYKHQVGITWKFYTTRVFYRVFKSIQVFKKSLGISWGIKDLLKVFFLVLLKQLLWEDL